MYKRCAQRCEQAIARMMSLWILYDFIFWPHSTKSFISEKNSAMFLLCCAHSSFDFVLHLSQSHVTWSIKIVAQLWLWSLLFCQSVLLTSLSILSDWWQWFRHSATIGIFRQSLTSCQINSFSFYFVNDLSFCRYFLLTGETTVKIDFKKIQNINRHSTPV